MIVSKRMLQKIKSKKTPCSVNIALKETVEKLADMSTGEISKKCKPIGDGLYAHKLDSENRLIMGIKNNICVLVDVVNMKKI